MELLLTSEQSMLRDSAAKFAGEAGAKVARRFRGQEPAFAPERLRQAAELGWLSILVPESAGGLGTWASPSLRWCCIRPAAASCASRSGSPRCRRLHWPRRRRGAPHPLLAQVMDGSLLIVPALQETPHGGGASRPLRAPNRRRRA